MSTAHGILGVLIFDVLLPWVTRKIRTVGAVTSSHYVQPINLDEVGIKGIKRTPFIIRNPSSPHQVEGRRQTFVTKARW